jgi:hypothetical protein
LDEANLNELVGSTHFTVPHARCGNARIAIPKNSVLIGMLHSILSAALNPCGAGVGVERPSPLLAA